MKLTCIAISILAMASGAFAGSATWNLNPTSGDWNTATNWTPATVPNGPTDTATFGVSNITGLSLSAATEIDGIVFSAGASAYTITAHPFDNAMTISGVGITNNSGSLQNFAAGAFLDNDGEIFFTNSATAGSLTAFTNRGGDCDFGGPASTSFFDTSRAGNGTFTNSGSACSENIGGSTSFFDTASAENGTFTNNGGLDCTSRSFCGGSTRFDGTSTAGNATLIAYGGEEGGAIFFWSDSTGGTARVEVFDNGYLDINSHRPPGVTVGSIEGTGNIFLGANDLAVGSNNLSTTFSGVIQGGGSFSKIGRGRLVLTGANHYAGKTIIKKGHLVINNSQGSGTGNGPVILENGALGGRGTIAGSVMVGNGVTGDAVLAPGKNADTPQTLTVRRSLGFSSNGSYHCSLNSNDKVADAIVAHGVTLGGATFFLQDVRSTALTPGLVFIVINNTATTPINGSFINMPDGSGISAGFNTFEADYEGGDGNDLTLTVVP